MKKKKNKKFFLPLILLSLFLGFGGITETQGVSEQVQATTLSAEQAKAKKLAKVEKEKKAEYARLKAQLARKKAKKAKNTRKVSKNKKATVKKTKKSHRSYGTGDTYTASHQKIIGNKRSKIYHVPGQAGYHMNSSNAVFFNSEKEAIAAGYRKALR